jgi:hypothetical protein
MSLLNLLEEKGDIVTRVRRHLSVRWKDKRDVYVLTNMYTPPFKPHVVEDYSAYLGLVDKSDRIVNSYGIARRTWKWTKKLFLHLLHMTILNVYLLHKSCDEKIPLNIGAGFDDLILQSHEANITVEVHLRPS